MVSRAHLPPTVPSHPAPSKADEALRSPWRLARFVRTHAGAVLAALAGALSRKPATATTSAPVPSERWAPILQRCPIGAAEPRAHDPLQGMELANWVVAPHYTAQPGDVQARARDALAFVFTPPTDRLTDFLDQLSVSQLQELATFRPEARTVRPALSDQRVTELFRVNHLSPRLLDARPPLLQRVPVLTSVPRRLEVPITAYGERWAHALMDAQKVVAVFCDPRRFASLTREYKNLLRFHTFQEDVDVALREGAATFAHASQLLMPNVIANLSAPDLMDAVVASRLLERLTKAPGSLLVPLGLGGLLPREALVTHPHRHFTLSPEFEEILKARPASSRGCPVAVRDVPQADADGALSIRAGSAVERFNHAMARVTRRLFENPPERPR